MKSVIDNLAKKMMQKIDTRIDNLVNINQKISDNPLNGFREMGVHQLYRNKSYRGGAVFTVGSSPV